ncbi:TBC1 domain family member 31 [Plasmodiophora brassicae]
MPGERKRRGLRPVSNVTRPDCSCQWWFRAKAMERTPDGKVACVHVEGQGGRIWPRAPVPLPTGLLSILRPAAASVRAGIRAVRFNVRGDKFVTGDARGNIHLFHVLQNRYSLVCRAGSCPTAMQASPSPNAIVAIAFDDGTIRIVDSESCNVVATLKGHRARLQVTSLSFHPTGQFLASNSKDRVIIWDAREWRRRRTLESSDAELLQATYGPTGSDLLTCVSDEGIVSWDCVKFKMLFQLPNTRTVRNQPASLSATCFAISSDSRYLIAGGQSANLFLWETKIQCLLRIAVLPSSVRFTVQLQFLPDCDVAFVLGDDGVLLVFNVLSLKVLLTLQEQHKAIVGFDIGPGGRYCTCIMSDGSISLYDLDKAFQQESSMVNLRIKSGQSESEAIRRLGSLPVFDQTVPDTTASEPSKPNDRKWSARDTGEYDDENDGFDERRASASTGSSLRSAGTAEPSPNVETAPNHVPLFEMTASNGKGKLLDPSKLKSLLKAYGEYPAEYRTIIWRFLMRLPENRDQYAAFENKGLHPALKLLHKQYPLQDRRLFRQLQHVLSALAHWSPMFSEVDFLPSLIFPFIRLFPADNVVCFEMVASILLNWGRRWFEFFPNPPSAVLKHVDDLLRYHDSALLAHFMAHGLEPAQYSWPLIRTLFTEVFTKSEWLIFFDHVVSNRPSFLLFVVAAYLKNFRGQLLGIENHRSIEQFVSHSNTLGKSVAKLMHDAYSMRRNTPADLLPHDEPWIALHVDHYPEFEYYPKFVVDFQIKERERIRMEEEEIESKKHTLEELQRKSEELERERVAWQQQQEALRLAEVERRAVWAQEEAARLRERQRIDRQALARRRAQIDSKAAMLQAQMQTERDRRMAELKRAEDEELRRRARDEYELEQRLEEEALLNLEFQVDQTIVQAHGEQARQEELEKRRLELERRKKARELRMAQLKEQWRIEDEERSLRQRALKETREKLTSLSMQMREQQVTENQEMLEQLDQEMSLARIQRERRLRHLAQEQLEKSLNEEQEQTKRAELLAQEEQRGKAELLEQERRWRKKVEEEREAIIRAEQSRAALETEKRAHRLRHMEREQRRKMFAEEIRKRHLEEKAKLVSEEKEMESVLLGVEEEARRGRELELEIKWRDEQMQEQLAFQKILKEAETQIMNDERRRYEELQQEMRKKFKDEEEALERQHRSALEQLVTDREKVLSEHSAAWRESVRSQHLEEIEKEYQENMERQRQMKERYGVAGTSPEQSIGGLRAEFRNLLHEKQQARGEDTGASKRTEEDIVFAERPFAGLDARLEDEAQSILRQHEKDNLAIQ